MNTQSVEPRRTGRILLLALCLAWLGAAAGAATAAESTNAAGPRIQFATPIHDFGKLKPGETVRYTYVFTNTGDQLLEISGVHTSCGCTTAGEWSRQVEPGQTGDIPIQFTSGAMGGTVAKSITVSCNDPTRPTVPLELTATVWKPIDVAPQFSMIPVTTESPSNSTIVRIVSNEEAPLTLSPPESNNRSFTAELKTNQPGKVFELIIRTVAPLSPANVHANITLKTSSPEMPVITINVMAVVQQTLVVAPDRIVLPPAPLARGMPYTVSIRYNGTNTLELTEPSVNVKGVVAQVRVLQPGHYFSITTTFPAGFELPQGEKVELTVKSNHPQYPVIRVPVQQPPPATSLPGQVKPRALPPRPVPR